MSGVLTTQQIIFFVILLGAFWLLFTEWLKNDVVAILVILTLALTQLLNDMEALLAVPVQTLCNLIGMLGKPSGAERPITLTTALYMLYCNVWKVLTVQWDREHVGFWDDAVRGSSALTAAIKRNIFFEACVALGISGAQIL